MVKLRPRHRFYPGCVLGLSQPSLHVVLAFAPLSPAHLEVAESCMRRCLGEDTTEPGMTGHPRGGHDVQRAERLARRIAEWTAALQRKVHIPVSRTVFCRPLATDDRTIEILVAMPCKQAAIALKTLDWVVRTLQDAARDASVPSEEAVERLLDEIRSAGEHGTNTFHIAEAAYRIGMPVRRPLGGTLMRRTLVIGTGCHARWFQSTITERTSAFGVQTAGDKSSTAKILREAGLPGAVHEFADTTHAAVAAATRLGYPVVVKPADRDQGVGVAADLRTADDVIKAFESARQHSKAILVERHCDGFTHRLTVVDGRLVKAVKRIAGGVFGDGIHDIATLIRIAETDPRRQRRRLRTGLSPLSLDAEAGELLSQAGLNPGSIPAPGTYVRLRRRDNVNAGGTNETVPLERVHPDNHALAVRTAALLRLDIAGVDLIIDDIAQSWLTRDAVICEVNAQPQMGVSGTPDVYCDLLREMLADGARIPVDMAMTIGQDVPSDEIVEHGRRKSGAQTVAHAGGLFVDGVRISRAFRNGFEAATAALLLPDTRSLLFLMSSEEVNRTGLPVDRIDRIGLIGRAGADEATRALVQRAMALAGPCSRTQEQW